MLTPELNLYLLSISGRVCRLRLQNREANANASISSKPLLSSSIMTIISGLGRCCCRAGAAQGSGTTGLGRREVSWAAARLALDWPRGGWRDRGVAKPEAMRSVAASRGAGEATGNMDTKSVVWTLSGLEWILAGFFFFWTRLYRSSSGGNVARWTCSLPFCFLVCQAIRIHGVMRPVFF
jgi:hypothetical protein